MSLQDKMTSLANNIRKVSWQIGKIGLDEMNRLLSNLLVFNSTMPYIIMNDGKHHGPSNYQEGYQVFNFGSATNCNYLKFSEPYLGIMGGIVNLLLAFGNCSSLIKEV